MPKNKRKSDSENAVEEKKSDRVKSNCGKRLKTGFATLAICAAAFGAYYSPHFRAASSDWLERGRAFVAAKWANGVLSKDDGASADDKAGEKLAQAPSFRDFLTEEYGEEGARELLGIDALPANVASIPSAGGGFADYSVAETNAGAPTAPQGAETDFDATSFPSATTPGTSFADYVAAESAASESVGTQPLANKDAASPTSPVSESGLSFADYIAAESAASESAASQDLANDFDAAALPADLEADSSFVVDDFDAESKAVSIEEKQLASTGAGEDETALAARLQDEMKERGVGNPRIERWGERFWRASGFATTDEGVATYCEAVDVDPTAAQRAALAKFDAASF